MLTPVPSVAPNTPALRPTSAADSTTGNVGRRVADFWQEGLGYCYEPGGQGILLRLDYLRERSDEYSGEITVESTLPGIPPHLHQARLNISSTTARATLAKQLAELTPEELNLNAWRRVLEQFCVAVLRRERQGEPLLRIGRLTGARRAPDQIEKLLPAGKPTLWYGPYQSGKGWMATFAAVCVQTGTPLAGLRVGQGDVLYLDWEDSAETLNERVQVVAAGLHLEASPEIAYRRCKRTLVHDLHQLLHEAHDLTARLIIIDSVGPAAGAAGEIRSYEDVARSFFDALRLFEPATLLLIDHVTGEASRDTKIVGRPYGSVYKMAAVRCAWEVRAEREAGANTSSIGCYHTKYNHTMRYPPLGFRLEFGPSDPGDSPLYVSLAREDLRDTAHEKNLSLVERISGALRRGALTTRDLAETLEEGEPSLRTTLNRHVGKRFVRFQDGRWAMLDTAHDDPDGGGSS